MQDPSDLNEGKYSDDDDDDDSESGEKCRSSKGKWTTEEDDILRNAVLTHGGRNWKKISEYLDGRTDVQCLHRWQKVLRPGLVKGPWTVEEDESVIQLVAKHGVKSWSFIARQLKGRLGKQCRERWYNHLNPAISKTPWTEEEDRQIIECHEKYGNKWAVIATYLPGRTDNAIKNRWNSTLQRLLKQSADGTLRRKKSRAGAGSGRKGNGMLDALDDNRSSRSVEGSYSESVVSEDFTGSLYEGAPSMSMSMSVSSTASEPQPQSQSQPHTLGSPDPRCRGYHTPYKSIGELEQIRITASQDKSVDRDRDPRQSLDHDELEHDRDQVLREMRWKLRMRSREKVGGVGAGPLQTNPVHGTPLAVHKDTKQLQNPRDRAHFREDQEALRQGIAVPIERISFDTLASPSILRRPPMKKRRCNALLDDDANSSSTSATAASMSAANLPLLSSSDSKKGVCLPPAKRFRYDSEDVLAATPSVVGRELPLFGAPLARRTKPMEARVHAAHCSSSPRRESLRGIFQSSEKSSAGAIAGASVSVGSPVRIGALTRSRSPASEARKTRKELEDDKDRVANPVPARLGLERRLRLDDGDLQVSGMGSTSSEACDGDSPSLSRVCARDIDSPKVLVSPKSPKGRNHATGRK